MSDKPEKYPFTVFPWDDDVTNENGWVSAKEAMSAFDALQAKCAELQAANETLGHVNHHNADVNFAELKELRAQLTVAEKDYAVCDAERDTLKAQLQQRDAEIEKLKMQARNPTAYPTAMDYAEHLEDENKQLHSDWHSMKAALEKMRDSQYCNYGGPAPSQYKIGVADGHRLCADWSRETLQQLKYKGAENG